jgi:hypothetical protein
VFYIFFGVFLSLFLLVMIFREKYEEFHLLINHPYLCIKNDLGYEEATFFDQNEDKYICGRIVSTTDEYKVRIRQYFYIRDPNSDEFRSLSEKDADYYELIWFTSADSAIPLHKNLPVGFYTIEMDQGRDVICKIDFEVR